MSQLKQVKLLKHKEKKIDYPRSTMFATAIVPEANMGTIDTSGDNRIRQAMRLLLTVLMILSQTGCTALLIGGGQSGQYPAKTESGQVAKDCDEDPEQDQCK